VTGYALVAEGASLSRLGKGVTCIRPSGKEGTDWNRPHETFGKWSSKKIRRTVSTSTERMGAPRREEERGEAGISNHDGARFFKKKRPASLTRGKGVKNMCLSKDQGRRRMEEREPPVGDGTMFR